MKKKYSTIRIKIDPRITKKFNAFIERTKKDVDIIERAVKRMNTNPYMRFKVIISTDNNPAALQKEK